MRKGMYEPQYLIEDSFLHTDPQEVDVKSSENRAGYSSMWIGHDPMDAFHVGPSERPFCSEGSKTRGFQRPHYYWYNFKESFQPARISLLPRGDCCHDYLWKFTPTQFEFIGWNGNESSIEVQWTTLCKYVDPKPITGFSPDEPRICDVNRSEIRPQSFNYLGLRVLEIGNDVQHFNDDDETCFRNLRFWKWE